MCCLSFMLKLCIGRFNFIAKKYSSLCGFMLLMRGSWDSFESLFGSRLSRSCNWVRSFAIVCWSWEDLLRFCIRPDLEDVPWEAISGVVGGMTNCFMFKGSNWTLELDPGLPVARHFTDSCYLVKTTFPSKSSSSCSLDLCFTTLSLCSLILAINQLIWVWLFPITGCLSNPAFDYFTGGESPAMRNSSFV